MPFEREAETRTIINHDGASRNAERRQSGRNAVAKTACAVDPNSDRKPHQASENTPPEYVWLSYWRGASRFWSGRYQEASITVRPGSPIALLQPFRIHCKWAVRHVRVLPELLFFYSKHVARKWEPVSIQRHA